jgi:hypothetical protein
MAALPPTIHAAYWSGRSRLPYRKQYWTAQSAVPYQPYFMWKEELPCDEEYETPKNQENAGWHVDAS